MAGRERRQWKPFYKHSGSPEAIAEPLHRIAPEGVSSGVSMRELPRATVEQVRKICEHFVTKCSGKYENNVAAARYVYEMADEILGQLSALEAYCKQEKDMAASLHEVFDEWERYFPLELQQNTPAAISARLRDQQQQILQLTQELERCRRKYDVDIQQLQRVLDQHQNAAKVSQAHDRHRQQEQLQELASQYSVEQAARQGQMEKHIEDLQQENARLRLELSELAKQRTDEQRAHEAALREEKNALRERYLGEMSALHNEIERLRGEAANQRGQRQTGQSPPPGAIVGDRVRTPPGPDRPRPAFSPLRQSGQSIRSTQSTRSQVESMSTSTVTPPRPRPRNSGVSTGNAVPPPVEAMHTFPPSQQLRGRINELEKCVGERDTTITDLKNRNTELNNENTRLRRRIAAVEDTNWHMRDALKKKLNVDVPADRTGSFGGSRPIDYKMVGRHGRDPRIAELDAPATSWSQRELVRPDHEEYIRDKEFWMGEARGGHPLFSVVV